MPTAFKPYVLTCTELACQRRAAAVTHQMNRRVVSLASIAVTAPLFGMLGSVFGIMNAFQTYVGPKSVWLQLVVQRLTISLIPIAWAILISVFTLAAYRALTNRLHDLTTEMDNQSKELINRLVLYLRQSAHIQPIHFRPSSLTFTRFPDGSADQPIFIFKRIYPNGLLTLLWPRIHSESDAYHALHCGTWVVLTSAFFAFAATAARPIASCIIVGFLILSALLIRIGSRLIAVGTFAFILFTVGALMWRLQPNYSNVMLALIAPFLLGTLKAAWSLPRRPVFRHLPAKIAFVVFFLAAGLAVIADPTRGEFSPANTVITDWVVSDSFVKPNLQPGHRVLTLKTPSLSPGNIVAAYFPWLDVTAVRIVGLPGDRIQVRAGKLIRNGKPVDEPYIRTPYTLPLGDFPLPSDAYPSPTMRWKHDIGYRTPLSPDKPFILPADSYFVLNDDRSQLTDSRLLGPVREPEIIGRIIFAF